MKIILLKIIIIIIIIIIARTDIFSYAFNKQNLHV